MQAAGRERTGLAEAGSGEIADRLGIAFTKDCDSITTSSILPTRAA